MYHFLKKYCSAFQFWRYIITLPFYYINAMLPALGLYMGVWIAEHTLSFYQLAGLVILLIVLYFVLGKVAIYHQKVLYDSVYQAGKNLKADLLEVMMKHRELSVDSSVLLNDVEKIEENLFLGGIELVEQIVFYLLAFGIICYFNIWAAAILLVISFFVAFINKKSREKGMFYQAKNSEQQEQQLNFLEQTEQGYETILMYQQQERMQKQFYHHADMLCKTQGQLRWNQEKVQILTMTFLFFSFPVCVLGGNFLMPVTGLTLAQIMMTVQLSNYLFKPIQKVMIAWFQVQSVQKTAEKLSGFFDQKDILLSSMQTKNVSDSYQKLQMAHQLRVHLDSFAIQEKELLKSVDFSVEKGEKILLLGANGCGKTTLLKYLLGYYGYQEGSVWIDGIDCSQVSWETASSAFASVDQNFFLLSGSVKENIGCFQELPQKILQKVISLCDLEEVAERKEVLELSGGQMQRVAIARAAASNRSILIFDEAFSAVDVKHHFQIEQELLQNSDLTLLEVVHQISEENYFLFDKVILMGEGRIVKAGTPQQLQQESFVRNLWKKNKGEEENEREEKRETKKSSDSNSLAFDY